jgi:urea transporter
VDLKSCKVCELSVESPLPSLLLGRPSTLLLAEDVGGVIILLCLVKVSKLNIYWQLRTNVGIAKDGMVILMSCFFLYRRRLKAGSL